MKRRSFVLVVAAIPMMARAQATPQLATLAVLVKALGEAGEALSKLTKGIRDMVTAGGDAVTYITAERQRDRLYSISQRMAVLIVSKQSRIVNNLDEYIALVRENASSGTSTVDLVQAWRDVSVDFAPVLQGVRDLLRDVKNEKSDMVADDSYLKLLQSLESRSLALERISSMSPPVTAAEIELLTKVNIKYAELLKYAKEALVEFNQYLKTKKK